MTETMTQQEALKEAQRRWGAAGVIAHAGNFYVVGVKHSSMGSGDSFEAAFADAERKEKRG